MPTNYTPALSTQTLLQALAISQLRKWNPQPLLVKTDKNGASNPVTGLLKSIVVQANEHSDLPTLNKFIEAMPIPDVKHLRNVYEKIKPDLDLRFDFTCPLCHEEGKVGMPLTARFFWPDA